MAITASNNKAKSMGNCHELNSFNFLLRKAYTIIMKLNKSANAIDKIAK